MQFKKALRINIYFQLQTPSHLRRVLQVAANEMRQVDYAAGTTYKVMKSRTCDSVPVTVPSPLEGEGYSVSATDDDG